MVPITWPGKIVASCCALLGISFFALPAVSLGAPKRDQPTRLVLPTRDESIISSQQFVSNFSASHCIALYIYALYKMLFAHVNKPSKVYHDESQPTNQASRMDTQTLTLTLTNLVP